MREVYHPRDRNLDARNFDHPSAVMLAYKHLSRRTHGRTQV
jgi:hypothetical protein